MKKKIINNFKNNLYINNLTIPTLKKNNIIKLYFYTFILNRWEHSIITGKVIKVKQRSNITKSSTLTIQKKLYGVEFTLNINLNNLNLIGIRVIK